MNDSKNIVRLIIATCTILCFTTIGSATPQLHNLSPIFPPGCGTFSVTGTLNYSQKKITIWTGSPQESALAFDAASCARCKFLDSMVVKILLKFEGQNKLAKIQEIKAVLSDLPSEAVKVREAPCP